jgi:ACS family hexuronate transporter-like MFS transporter
MKDSQLTIAQQISSSNTYGTPWSRWVAFGVFSLSTILNFLDRQLLAAVGPALREEFLLSNEQYGQIIALFSMSYAVGTPLFGLFVDRAGIGIGASASVALWSLASIATGFTKSFTGLLACRAGLGFGESGTIPCASKAGASFLPSKELGLGTAPLLVAYLAPLYGWRSVFVVSGLLGVPWVALWWVTSKKAAKQQRGSPVAVGDSLHLLRSKHLWAIAVTYALVMAQYTFWLNWTTLYFVQDRHLSMAHANQYFAWIPPLFATAGGFFGGGLAYRWIHQGTAAVSARTRVYLVSLPILLLSATVPWLSSPGLAAVGIGCSFFACMSIVSAVHVLPIDLFGAQHAAFSVSLLGSSYALMQMFASPLIGAIVDRVGFTPICVTAPLLPLLGFVVVSTLVKPRCEVLAGAATA